MTFNAWQAYPQLLVRLRLRAPDAAALARAHSSNAGARTSGVVATAAATEARGFRVEQMLLEEEQHPGENRGACDDADQEEGEKKERDREQLRRHRCSAADLEA